MLQGKLAIDASEEIAGPQRGWFCDPVNSMFERSLPNIAGAQWLHGRHDGAARAAWFGKKGFGVQGSVLLSTSGPVQGQTNPTISLGR